MMQKDENEKQDGKEKKQKQKATINDLQLPLIHKLFYQLTANDSSPMR